MARLHLDFETAAVRDLRKVGVHEYVQCPEFRVTVVAWAFDDEPVKSVAWPDTTAIPDEIWDHIARDGEIHAWNAAFEHTVLTGYYRLGVPAGTMRCTMQRALAFGLPAALGDAGPALGLAIVKDTSAHSLMMRMGKPKKSGGWWHETDPAKLAMLEAYCRRDVEAEREIGRHIPLLSEFEQRVSAIDAYSNAYGVRLDGRAIARFMTAREKIREETAARVAYLTGGMVTRIESEVGALQVWLRSHGVDLPSVDKDGVAGALDGTLPPVVRQVLELRQASAKSSLGKLEKMLLVQGTDERARGMLQYYGAGRTGRWAGRHIQVQNLPKNLHGVDPEMVLGVIAADPGGLELFYERPLETLSECLRGCLTASPGKLLAMVDLSQIEARVLAWLAGQDDVLGVFYEGGDVYAYAAERLGSGDRQLGKVVTLACGYQMGAERFRETAIDYGVVLSEEQAVSAVVGWRQANPKIVSFWWAMDAAVREAILRPGTMQTVGMVRLRVKGGRLYVRKPNGGTLVYHRPRVVDREILFDGVSQTTKRWGVQKTYGGKLVENVTQAVARDIMASAMVRIEREMGRRPVMTVHDELVYEIGSEAEGRSIQALVDEAPEWAEGLPVASKLHMGFRYGK